MAKQNFKKAIDTAVTRFSKGSSDLVRLYEKAILSYWNMEEGGDRRSCDNLQYFANALRFHPFIQGALVSIIRRHGSFDIQSIEKLEDGKKVKTFAINNSKKKLTEAEITGYIKLVTDFVAKQFASFLHEDENAKKNPFDWNKRLNSFGANVATLLAMKLANSDDTDADVSDVIAALKAKIDEIAQGESMKAIREKAKTAKAEQAAVEGAAQAIAEQGANAETANDEQAA